VLVDDAIVEIENIVRHMRMGKSPIRRRSTPPTRSACRARDHMAIVAVFLPVGLMPGISGQFFKNFGFTVVVAVLMSLLVARMITPLMAAYFLKSHGEEPHARKWMAIICDAQLDASMRGLSARHPGSASRCDHRWGGRRASARWC
jgi:multidrug efflux pump subunit AcrB